MKSIKLTQKILQAIIPKAIIYAEFADDGAMGACGTARIFTIEDGKLKFYLIDGVFGNQANEEIYAAVSTYLNKLVADGTLEYLYAGYGNHAYKPLKAKFSRDDDHSTFIYTKSGATYQIPASCQGVYEHTVGEFATREVSIEALEDYLRVTNPYFSEDEASFYKEYLAKIKRTDSGQGWFDFTALDYLNAIKYLRHLSGKDYLLNWEDVLDSRDALNKYRLKYVVDRLGQNQLDAIFAKLVKTKSAKLFPTIEKSLGEKVDDIYGALEVIKPDHIAAKDLTPDKLEQLFSRPVLIDFSKSAHAAIIKDIIDRPGNSFNPDAKPIAYYLANYLLNEDKLPYSDILPAVVHIVSVMPDDDFNHTHTDELFWLCGEIIDRAWRYLKEDKDIQEKYRDLIYEIYWPRVGSLWPVLNRDRFEFKYSSAEKIFDDSLSFVMSLDDITERNAEIKSFFTQNARHIGYKAGPLGRRAFCYSLRGLSSEQEFSKILNTIEPDDYYSYLTYPDTIKDAEILLHELFRTDDGARITGTPRLACLESLVITPNTMGVGEYILNCLDQHFGDLVTVLSTEAFNLGYSNATGIFTDLFIAMSKGITEENEFPPFKSLKEKFLSLGCDAEKLANAATYARHHRRAILFQRSTLQKLF